MEKIDFIVNNLQSKQDRIEAAKKTGLTERTMLNIINKKRASPVSIKLLCKHFKWIAK